MVKVSPSIGEVDWVALPHGLYIRYHGKFYILDFTYRYRHVGVDYYREDKRSFFRLNSIDKERRHSFVGMYEVSAVQHTILENAIHIAASNCAALIDWERPGIVYYDDYKHHIEDLKLKLGDFSRFSTKLSYDDYLMNLHSNSDGWDCRYDKEAKAYYLYNKELWHKRVDIKPVYDGHGWRCLPPSIKNSTLTKDLSGVGDVITFNYHNGEVVDPRTGQNLPAKFGAYDVYIESEDKDE